MNNYEHIDLDAVETDPRMAQHIKDVLDAASTNKNTITIVEFTKYKPLFHLNGRELIGDGPFNVLVDEYYSRIDPYTAVRVVDNDRKVMFTLPPMFRKVRPLNFAGQAGMDVNSAFINANNLEDPFGTKRRTYCDLCKDALTIAQDRNEKERVQLLAQEQSNAVTGNTRASQDVTPEAVEVVMDGTVEII